MKKFRLAVLAAVICTAALLTSCIKEESYEVETAYLVHDSRRNFAGSG